MERAGVVRPGERKALVVGLGGNPNTGKRTIFNLLTGLHQHVGNWSGVTVGLAEGSYRRDGREYRVVDLPGTYSLAATSANEVVAREFLVSGEADVVVVCLHMMAEVERNGLAIDVEELARELGVPVTLTIARTGEGLDGLRRVIAGMAADERRVTRQAARSYGEDRVGDGAAALYREVGRIVELVAT